VDLLDVAILVLRLALVAVLYAFLIMVMRVAARGLLTSPRSAPAASGAGLRLIVLEAGSSALRSGEVLELPDPATLGRSAHAEVVIADSAVSAEHARVFRVGRAWVVTDLGSTNGTRVNETPVSGEMPLAPDDVLALGTVRLQVAPR
jgi:pSer/pThr/pTyr-binding forkhead associated (FHA) protein